MALERVEMSLRTTRRLRFAGWAAAALLLLAPAAAMLLGSTQVHWTASDFAFAATLFALVGGALELAARASTSLAYRLGALAAAGCGLLQVWITAAVGIIGTEGDPANWTYLAVVVIAGAGAITAAGDPRALARMAWCAAGAQFAFSILHAAQGTPTAVIDAFFIALWLVSARLFGRAARERDG